MITQDRLKKLLYYDNALGLFIRRVYIKKSKYGIGSIAGNIQHNGYVRIKIDNKKYLAHRLAWLYTYGVWPNIIDHKNGIRHDNRLHNLRSVDHTLNIQNQRVPGIKNKTGFLGVCLQKGRFKAKISVNNKSIHLGYYNTAEEAYQAYLTAKRELHITCTI